MTNERQKRKNTTKNGCYGQVSSDVDSLFFMAYGEELYNEMVRKFISEKINLPIYTSGLIISDVAHGGVEDYLNGVKFSQSLVSRDLPSSVELIDRLKFLYGEDFADDLLFNYVAAGYDVPQILQEIYQVNLERWQNDWFG